MICTEKIIVNIDSKIDNWIGDTVSLYNRALYILRQEYFGARKENRKPNYPSKKQIYAEISQTEDWKNSTLDHPSKSAAINRASKDFDMFYKSVMRYNKDKSGYTGRPKPPNYKSHDSQGILEIDKTRIATKDYKNHIFGLPKYNDYKVKVPDYIDLKKIRCVNIVRYYGKLMILIMYDVEPKNLNLSKTNFLGIDIGVANTCAMTSNGQIGKSWLIKGGSLKSINQFYNKQLAELQNLMSTVTEVHSDHKEKGCVTNRMKRLIAKRNNKIDYKMHCISKEIIRICVENNIGVIVIGHNECWKQNSNLGRRNNQNFVQIPFNKLIQKIQYKAELVGIDVIIVNESYTSKCDHLVGETMTHHDEYFGKRSPRGLFTSSIGKILNSDINGAIGILLKAKALTEADIAGLRDRGDVVSPVVLNCGFDHNKLRS